MGLSELIIWAPPLVALLLCVRAVVSRDRRGWRLAAVGAAFVPDAIPLVARSWVGWTGAAAGTRDTIFPETVMLAPVVPATFLLAWAVRTADTSGWRAVSAIAALLGLVPVIISWLLIASAMR